MLGRIWLLLCLGLVLLGPASADSAYVLSNGPLLDVRYGDLLLGGTYEGLNLRLTSSTRVRLNGAEARAEDLPHGKPAVVRWRARTGEVVSLDLVDPLAGREVVEGGDVWSIQTDKLIYRGGEVVVVEVRASGGLELTCEVVGLGRRALKEWAPGHFRASFPVAGVDLRETYVLVGGQEVPVKVGPRLTLAVSAPQILQRGPEGARLGDEVFVHFRSPGCWVSRASLRIDGESRPFRRNSSIMLSSLQGLAAGRHRVEVVLVDAAGNSARSQWWLELR